MEIIYIGDTQSILPYNSDLIQDKNIISLGNIVEYETDFLPETILDESLLRNSVKVHLLTKTIADYINDNYQEGKIDMGKLRGNLKNEDLGLI